MRAEYSVAEFRSTNRIDASGLVKGVSCITCGEAIGHGIHIDATSLETAQRIATGFTGGLKVKMEHTHGVDKIIGALRNFRIDGQQLRADLALLKAHPAFNFLSELITKQPTTFGLSLSFSCALEKIDGKDFVRFEDFYSCDIVDRPAANPGGLFSAHSSDPTVIAACYLAAYGMDKYRSVINTHGTAKAHDAFAREIYYSGLDVPGFDFSEAKRHGARKEPFGLRRLETSRQQARIDACLSRMK